MLPNERKIGISATYGAESTGSIEIPDLFSSPIKINLLKTQTHRTKRLQTIKNSFGIVTKGYKSGDFKTNVEERVNLSPQELLLKQQVKAIKQDPDPLQTKINNEFDKKIETYDPTKGNTIHLFKLGSKRMCVSKAGNGSVLSFVALDSKWKGWKIAKRMRIGRHHGTKPINEDQKLRRKEYEPLDFENDMELNLKTPTFKWAQSLSFASEIKQIELEKNNKENATRLGLLVVIRTFNVIHVLKIFLAGKSIRVTRIFDVKSDQKRSDFADVSITGSLHHKLLTIVDTEGKFSVYESTSINEICFQKLDLKYDSFFEPTELSNFKKSLWIGKEKLLLYSRSQLHEYNFANERFICRICAGTWSKILDVVHCPNNNHWVFLLTTKEIILVDATKGFKRMIAWKHYLNDIDTSFHINILRTSSLSNTCILSSKHINFHYAIEFDIENLKILNSPYYFITHPNCPVESINFAPLEDNCSLFTVYQISSTCEISSCILKFTSFFNNNRKYGKPIISDLVVPVLKTNGTSEKDYRLASLPKEFRRISKDILNYHLISIKSNEIDIEKLIQKYADEIGQSLNEFLNNNFRISSNLEEIAPFTNFTENGDEIEEMICQLMKHYNGFDEGFSFNYNSQNWMLERGCKYQIPIEEFDNVSHINKLHSFFHSLEPLSSMKAKLSKFIAIHLYLTSITVVKKKISVEEYKKETKQNIESLPTDLSDMFNFFEKDMTVAGIIDYDGEEVEFNETQESSQIFVPKISISQTSKKTKPKSSKRTPSSLRQVVSSQAYIPSSSQFSLSDNISSHPINSQPLSSQSSFSLSSSQAVKISQTRGGPKRKKRRTGF